MYILPVAELLMVDARTSAACPRVPRTKRKPAFSLTVAFLARCPALATVKRLAIKGRLAMSWTLRLENKLRL